MRDEVDGLVHIGDLAISLGITTRTIRYYEEVGLVSPSDRSSGSVRMYDKDGIVRLKFILKLKELGLSLGKIQELAEYYDLSGHDRDKCIPNLLQTLDVHIGRIDGKISKLSELRDDISSYRVRICKLLTGRETLNC